MNKKWIISIDSKYITPARLYTFEGTDEDVKQKLVDLCNEDRADENQDLAEYEERDPIYDFATIEQVEVNDIKNGFTLSANFWEEDEYGDESRFECNYQAIDLDMMGDM